MSKKTKIILYQIVPLLIGILIYALFRHQPPFERYLPWDNPIFDIGFLPRFLLDFILYNLSDALWAFAFVGALDMCIKKPLKSAAIVMIAVIVFEYCQLIGIIKGTGDVGDIFFSMCAVVIYTIFLGGRNEKMV
jgi:hypothetical protein